jgi:uncharacterized membrane protein YdjX (TVP38/TMEM64 family)
LISVLDASDTLIAENPALGAAVFVALAAASAMLAFMSVAVILPVAVFTWGEPLSILLLWIGWILGGACSYGIGRFLGRAVVRWLTAENTLQRIETHISAMTPFGVVLLFQLALPSEIPGAVLGLVRYRFSRFLLALALVELLYAVAMVQLGASFVNRRAGVIVALGIAVVLVSVVAFSQLRKRI